MTELDHAFEVALGRYKEDSFKEILAEAMDRVEKEDLSDDFLERFIIAVNESFKARQEIIKSIRDILAMADAKDLSAEKLSALLQAVLGEYSKTLAAVVDLSSEAVSHFHLIKQENPQ